MKWFLCSTFLCLLFLDVTAQFQRGSKGILDVHIVPLTLFDRNPRLRMGMEYHGSNKFGYNIEFGFGNNWLNRGRLRNSPWGQEYAFFEIRPELKWYPIEQDGFVHYWGAELFCLIMKDKFLNNHFYQEGTPLVMFFSEANFKKQKIGLIIKGGTKFIFSDRIMFDIYLGMGVAYRNIAYSDLINPSPSVDRPFGELITPSYRKEGNRFLFHPAFGVKAGFVVFQK